MTLAQVPPVLHGDVLKTAAAEMLEFGDSGQSVMEMSHHLNEYLKKIISEAYN